MVEVAPGASSVADTCVCMRACVRVCGDGQPLGPHEDITASMPAPARVGRGGRAGKLRAAGGLSRGSAPRFGRTVE